MKFNMKDIYGDRFGIPYPQIEELSLLYFKYNGKEYYPNKNKENELISQVKSLRFDEVEIHRYNGMFERCQFVQNCAFLNITFYNKTYVLL